MRRESACAGNRYVAISIALFFLGLLLATAPIHFALADDTTGPTVSGVALTRSYFSPNGDGARDKTWARFRVSERSRVTARVFHPVTRQLLRTLALDATVPAGDGALGWDGKDTSGTVVPDGRYAVRLFIEDIAGNRAATYPYSLPVWVDTVQPILHSVWATPNPFSPNARPDRYKDRTSIRFNISQRGFVDVAISGRGHTRRFTGLVRWGGTSGVTWDGRDQAGVRVDDGRYAVLVKYRDLAGNVSTPTSRNYTVIVDTTPPRLTSWSTPISTPYPRDGISDLAIIRFTTNEKVSVGYTIRNPFGVWLKGGRLRGLVAGRHRLTWNATQRVGTSSVVVPLGGYPARMLFSDVAGNRTSAVKRFVVRSFYLVVVDPGHGGKNGVYDSGAVGPTGLVESVVNFDIGYNRLRPLLSRMPASATNGYKMIVQMTRRKQYSPWMTLDKRSSLANRRGANIFVSIHSNAAGITVAHGTETFHRDGSVRGRRLAYHIQRRVLARTGLYDRGVKTEGFYVLRHTRMPAALHETAFISNPREERLLRSKTFRQKEALGIRDGVVSYFREYPLR